MERVTLASAVYTKLARITQINGGIRIRQIAKKPKVIERGFLQIRILARSNILLGYQPRLTKFQLIFFEA